MAEVQPPRCSCGRYLRRRPEGHDDWEAEERAYFHEFEECPCGGDVRGTGQFGDAPIERPGGRPARRPRGQPGKVRNYRFTCACPRPFKIRSGRRELDATCNQCGGVFEWEPSASEHTGEIKEGAA